MHILRRLTVEEAAEAHVTALERAPDVGFGTFVISAPPPFERTDAEELKRDAAAVVARRFPDAPDLYAAQGWKLPNSIGRVYDPSAAERMMGFHCKTDFAAILAALRDASYISPKEREKV